MKNMNTKIKTTIVITLLVVLSVGLILVTKPAPTGGDNLRASLNSVLQTNESSYNFGTVSMARGKVNREFSFVNAGNVPARISQIYTSCMCTTAVLDLDGKKFGPFGMPGHGFSAPIKAEIGANEAAKLKVVFDPAAHGPAGVGPIERVVYVGTSDGAILQFRIAALVTP